MSAKRIVVVDDCSFHLSLVREILEQEGFEVLTADSSIAANAYIYASPRPDLLLVDVEMPMLNGAEKVRLLKQRDSSRAIPTLLVSAKTDAELKALVAESGAEGYLCKPFTREALLATVSRHVAAA